MSQHDPLVRLRHMLDFANKAVELMGSHSEAQFLADETLLLAECRLVELIGEAANVSPKETLEQIPAIPWARVIRMRHRLIHGYDTISAPAVYEVVVADLPVLIRELTAFLSRADSSSIPPQE